MTNIIYIEYKFVLITSSRQFLDETRIMQEGCRIFVVWDLSQPLIQGNSLCGWVRSVHPTLPIAVAALVADCETKGHVKMGKENITSWSPYRSSFLPECATWQRIGQCGLAFHGSPVFECIGSR